MTSNTQDLSYDTSLAIVGMAGRFPGAKNIAEFWQNLISSVMSIRFFSDEELLAAGVDSDLLNDSNYVKAGAVIESVDLFDAPFFGFTPREAEIMDPQSRLFLQCAREVLEDAGYDPATYEGLIGVFAGKRFPWYLWHSAASNPDLVASVGAIQVGIGNMSDSLATMVSYKLDLKGPSVSVQTFCSTSLVAVHLACQSLLAYECDVALAGGASIQFPQGVGYVHQEGGITSPDGYCRAFDAKGQGSVFGDGLGIVAVKRLEDAIEDGDHIYAVIRGSAVNNDGIMRAGYTAPGLNGQAAVIAEALGNAGVHPETINYVETHGTATPLGDSVELEAMNRAFHKSTDKTAFCAIGSVKPNIGHLDRASGVAGLTKAALALQHKLLPPSLNFETPNPDFDWDNSPFYVNTELTKWESNGSWPRRAGVSSFGFGGTNVHIVLEETPELEPSSASRPYQLLLLSAKTEGALEIATTNLVTHLRDNPTLNLADVAYTLQVGRAAFNHRRVVVCHDLEDGANALAMNDPDRVFTAHQTHRERPVAFMFPGVGEHYPGMARQLYQTEPIFKQWIDHCCALLEPHLSADLCKVLYPPGEEAVTEEEQDLDLREMLGCQNNYAIDSSLQQAALAQPAVFVIEYALVRLLMAWGIQPKAMIGYSLGEYVAACLTGVMSLEDALLLVVKRAEMIGELAEGAMLTVSLSEAEIEPFLSEEVALTGVLTPDLSVLAGLTAAIAALNKELTAQGIVCRLLPTTHAFHSPMMSLIKDAFAQLVQTVTLNTPEIPYLSNVTGDWVTPAEATDPTHWTRHLCQTVQFSSGIGELLKNQDQVLLEVGPGQSLGSFARQHPDCDIAQASRVLSTIRYSYDEQSDSAFLLKTLGKLWLAGVEIDWTGFYRHERRQRLSLPTYPFERQRYWIEAKAGAVETAKTARRPTGKKVDIGNWFYQPVWKQTPAWRQLDAQALDADSGVWLLFLDRQGCGSLIAERLEKAGCVVVRVQVGTQFAQLGKNVYSLNPYELNDYRRLLKTLPTLPTQIAHLWGVDPLTMGDSPVERFAQAQQLGFYSLLFLIKAIGQYSKDLSIWAITSNAQPVTGAEVLCPEKATTLGVCRVIPQESLNTLCHYIDIAWPQDNERQTAWLADQLIAEFVQKPNDLVVAYRGNRRWKQIYESVYLEAVDKPVLRQNGVYLITGGLGAIGTILAQHLAESAQAKVILTGRSAFPARGAWSDWLASHSADDSVSDKIRRLQALEALGAEVLVMQADAADEAQMMAVLAQIEAQFGALHGVIHAAGISSDQRFFASIQELSVEQCEAHFGPKVYGLYVLEKVLAGKELDFCVLFSSLASVLGGLGFGAYVAANIFIDAFTHQHNRHHSQWWRSVNWDTWRTRADQHEMMGATVAEFEMLPAEAIQAFERVVANGPLEQLVNSTGDLEARLDQWVRLVSIHGADDSIGEATTLHPRPELIGPYIAPTNEVEKRIAEIWQDLLGIEPIGINDNFFELGGHSLIAIQVVSQLRQVFQVHLPLPILLTAPTIAELAVAVGMAIIEELEGLADEEASSLV